MKIETNNIKLIAKFNLIGAAASFVWWPFLVLVISGLVPNFATGVMILATMAAHFGACLLGVATIIKVKTWQAWLATFGHIGVVLLICLLLLAGLGSM